MRSGGGNQYDMVSASGDASLRLINGGDVQAVNPDADSRLQELHPAAEVAAAQHGRRACTTASRCSGARTRCSTTRSRSSPAPTSWGALYDSKYKGKVTVPDNPIQIADAALYLSKTKPALGIKDPYELNAEAVRRRGRAAQAAEAARQEVLGARVGRDRPLQERRRHDRRVVAVPDQHADRRQGAREGHDPGGGSDRLGRHVDDRVNAQHPNCAYMWMKYVSTPKVQAQQAIYFGETPANTKACADMDKLRHGLVRAVPRGRAGVVLQARSSSGRRPSPTAATARRLHGLHAVAAGLDARSRASRLTSQAVRGGGPSLAARPPPCLGGALAPAVAARARRCSRRRSLGSCSIYLAALAVLFVSAFWTVDPFTGEIVHIWTLDNFRHALRDADATATIALAHDRHRGARSRSPTR